MSLPNQSRSDNNGLRSEESILSSSEVFRSWIEIQVEKFFFFFLVLPPLQESRMNIRWAESWCWFIYGIHSLLTSNNTCKNTHMHSHARTLTHMHSHAHTWELMQTLAQQVHLLFNLETNSLRHNLSRAVLSLSPSLCECELLFFHSLLLCAYKCVLSLFPRVYVSVFLPPFLRVWVCVSLPHSPIPTRTHWVSLYSISNYYLIFPRRVEHEWLENLKGELNHEIWIGHNNARTEAGQNVISNLSSDFFSKRDTLL